MPRYAADKFPLVAAGAAGAGALEAIPGPIPDRGAGPPIGRCEAAGLGRSVEAGNGAGAVAAGALGLGVCCFFSAWRRISSLKTRQYD